MRIYDTHMRSVYFQFPIESENGENAATTVHWQRNVKVVENVKRRGRRRRKGRGDEKNKRVLESGRGGNTMRARLGHGKAR